VFTGKVELKGVAMSKTKRVASVSKILQKIDSVGCNLTVIVYDLDNDQKRLFTYDGLDILTLCDFLVEDLHRRTRGLRISYKIYKNLPPLAQITEYFDSSYNRYLYIPCRLTSKRG
jgi:hypothetical protein